MKNNIKKYIIIKDRVELYKDFTINLLNYIIYYYIDYESMNTDIEIKNHYNWCFNKVCDEFLLEGINFKDNNELREYFHTYFYHQFYNTQNNPNQDISLSYYEKFWKNIFEIDKQINKNIINILIECYIIFDKSVNKNNNILKFI